MTNIIFAGEIHHVLFECIERNLLKSKVMKPNINSTDKIVRIIIGLVCFILLFTKSVVMPWSIVIGVAGGILIATALINFCPIYKILGVSTKKKS